MVYEVKEADSIGRVRGGAGRAAPLASRAPGAEPGERPRCDVAWMARSDSASRAPGPENRVGPPPWPATMARCSIRSRPKHDHCWWLDRFVRTLAPPGRAYDPRLALVVCDLQRRGRLAAADDRPERALPPKRARELRSAAPRRDPRSRDAALAERHAEREGRAERELRARDDGALHARRRAQRSATRRTSASRHAQLTGWQNRWSQTRGDIDFHFDPAEHDDGIKHVFHQTGRWRYGRRLPALSHPPPARLVLRQQALVVPSRPCPTKRILTALESPLRRFALKPVLGDPRHPDLWPGWS